MPSQVWLAGLQRHRRETRRHGRERRRRGRGARAPAHGRRRRAHRANLAFTGRDGCSGLRRRALVAYRARSRRAMPRCPCAYDLLADIAAFGEINAAKLVHISLMRESVAVAEVDAYRRRVPRDAERVVLVRLDERGAEARRRVGSAMRRYHQAQPQRRQTRIGIGKTERRRAASIPSRQNAKNLGQVLNHDARTQLV